jgi:hypothetical protein
MQAARETICSLSVDVDEQGRDSGEDTDDMLVSLRLWGGGSRGVKPSRPQPADRESP